jgi:asparagine synthase (glutamine-hydrolysing)
MPHFSPKNLAALASLFSRTSGGSDSKFFSHQIRFDNSNLAQRLLSEKYNPLEPLEQMVSKVQGFAKLSNVRRAQWLEFHTLLQGYLLSTQSDRMLFAQGVEPRCPFLSPSVVALAASLPDSSLLSPDFEEKHILKRAFFNDLPQRVLAKPKWPYRAPDISSFFEAGPDRPRMSDWVSDTLSTDNLQIGVLDDLVAHRFIEKIRQTPPAEISPRENQAFILLLSLVLLNEQFVQRRGIEGRVGAIRRAELTESATEPT